MAPNPDMSGIRPRQAGMRVIWNGPEHGPYQRACHTEISLIIYPIPQYRRNPTPTHFDMIVVGYVTIDPP